MKMQDVCRECRFREDCEELENEPYFDPCDPDHEVCQRMVDYYDAMELLDDIDEDE